MNIFRILFLFKSFVKKELSYVFTKNMFSTAENCAFFLLFVIIYVPPIILDSWFLHKSCCFDSDILLKFTKMVKGLHEFEYFLLYS